MEYKALFIPYKKENGSENATKSDNQKHKQGVKLVNAKMCRFRDTVPLKHARGIRASPFFNTNYYYYYYYCCCCFCCFNSSYEW